MFAHGFTVTVERPGGTDRHNNPLPGAPPHTVDGCATEPAGAGSVRQGSSERVGDSATVEWDLNLFAPYDADITAQDVILLPGDPERYAVTGRPARLRSPFTGWEAGMIARLKGVRG